ncbi:MAG: mobility-associated LCxxNW protein [Lachnospiraceae bacterium]|nr:mobility-associated LCxxNW protein [Lachnospiraceae bacterium]
MDNYCAFGKNHKCMKWLDYELTRQELKEADELCHGNWIEIQRLKERFHILESLLNEANITIS